MPQFSGPNEGMKHWIDRAEKKFSEGDYDAAHAAAAIAQAYATHHHAIRTS